MYIVIYVNYACYLTVASLISNLNFCILGPVNHLRPGECIYMPVSIALVDVITCTVRAFFELPCAHSGYLNHVLSQIWPLSLVARRSRIHDGQMFSRHCSQPQVKLSSSNKSVMMSISLSSCAASLAGRVSERPLSRWICQMSKSAPQ